MTSATSAPTAHRPGPATPAANDRARRLAAPLLLALWVLLAFEGLGGLVIFFARLAYGTTPGEALHVVVGFVLTFVYAAYQWRHWRRVAPFRRRLDYAMGALAAGCMVLAQATGLALGAFWWQERIAVPTSGEVAYPPLLSAAHNIGSMLVLTFAGAHVGAVLVRERRGRRAG